jgi:hypothetical protein
VGNIDPKLLESVRRYCEPGYEPELAWETEWEYVSKTGAKSSYRLSKFMLDRAIHVKASDIRERWPKLTENERLNFASNFWRKTTWDDNDTDILEIIMQHGDDRIWRNCALAFLHHPHRERAVMFLIDRLQKWSLPDEPLNYIQALGMCKDRRATPVIRPFYEKCRKAVEAEVVTGVPDDVFFGLIPYHAYLAICGCLFKIEGSAEYEEAIRKYLTHPHEQVRWWAEQALEIEGPTTIERNAVNKKKHLNRD